MSRKNYRVFMPGNPTLMDSHDTLEEACKLAEARSQKLESPMRVVATDNRDVGYIGYASSDFDYCSEDGFSAMPPREYTVVSSGLKRIS